MYNKKSAMEKATPRNPNMTINNPIGMKLTNGILVADNFN